MGLFDFLKPKKNPKPQPEDDEGNSADFNMAGDSAESSTDDSVDGCNCDDSDCGCDCGSSD